MTQYFRSGRVLDTGRAEKVCESDWQYRAFFGEADWFEGAEYWVQDDGGERIYFSIHRRRERRGLWRPKMGDEDGPPQVIVRAGLKDWLGHLSVDCGDAAAIAAHRRYAEAA